MPPAAAGSAGAGRVQEEAAGQPRAQRQHPHGHGQHGEAVARRSAARDSIAIAELERAERERRGREAAASSPARRHRDRVLEYDSDEINPPPATSCRAGPVLRSNPACACVSRGTATSAAYRVQPGAGPAPRRGGAGLLLNLDSTRAPLHRQLRQGAPLMEGGTKTLARNRRARFVVTGGEFTTFRGPAPMKGIASRPRRRSCRWPAAWPPSRTWRPCNPHGNDRAAQNRQIEQLITHAGYARSLSSRELADARRRGHRLQQLDRSRCRSNRSAARASSRSATCRPDRAAHPGSREAQEPPTPPRPPPPPPRPTARPTPARPGARPTTRIFVEPDDADGPRTTDRTATERTTKPTDRRDAARMTPPRTTTPARPRTAAAVRWADGAYDRRWGPTGVALHARNGSRSSWPRRPTTRAAPTRTSNR